MKTVLSVNQIDEVKGGSDRCFFNTNSLLRNNDIKVVEYYSSKDKEGFPKDTNFNNRNITNIARYFYNFEARKLLNKKIESIVDGVSIAHLHIYYGKLTTSIVHALKSKGIPIVQTLHEYKLSCPVYTHVSNNNVCESCITGSTINCIKNRCKDHKLIDSTVRYLEYNLSRIFGDVRYIDKFICVSEFQRQIMIKSGIDKHKLVTLYNFVDTSDIPIEIIDGDYLLYFGRLDYLKGVHTLIKSMAYNRDKELYIVGTGPYLDELLRLVKDLKLEENVFFKGFKQGQELWDIIKNCKAVVVPSEWYENCSMTVLEAKSYCKPVIGASIGGITEQIKDNDNGFLHEPGNELSISNAIERLYNSDYETISLNSRCDLEKRYSQQIHFNSLNSIYEEVISGCSN